MAGQLADFLLLIADNMNETEGLILPVSLPAFAGDERRTGAWKPNKKSRAGREP